MKEREREERKTSTKMVSHEGGRENRGRGKRAAADAKAELKQAKSRRNTVDETERTDGRMGGRRDSRQWAWSDSRDPKDDGTPISSKAEGGKNSEGMSNNENFLEQWGGGSCWLGLLIVVHTRLNMSAVRWSSGEVECPPAMSACSSA